MEKPIGWWRNGPDGLDVKQPTKTPDHDSVTFHSLVNVLSKRGFLEDGKLTLK